MKKLLLLFSLLTIIPNSKTIGYCDIKGNVKNPGVYEVLENQTIKDIIDKAGGLKKNSYTNNINLSKLVTDEMVIYIHSKNEIEKIKELNNCTCSPIYKYIECDNSEINTSTTTTITTTTVPITNTTTKNIITSQTTTEPITTTKITTKPSTIPTTQTTTSKIEEIKININTCTIEELITLKGLGESKAKSIIDYRNTNGLFNSIEDLLKVNGIGNKTFENIKDFIEV